MKKMTYFVMALALVLGFTQCKKEQTPANNETEGVFITLDVNGGNNTSRVEVTPGYENPTTHEVYARVQFESGDVIYVGNAGAYCGYLEYNGSTSQFEGTVNPTSEADYLHFYFMGNKGTTSQPTTVSITDQTSKYPVISYAHSKEFYSSSTSSYTAKLQNYCAIVKFTTTNSIPTDTDITVKGMKNTVSVNFGANNAATSTSGSPYTFTKSDDGDITLHAVSTSERWAILLEQDAVNGATVTASGYSNSTCNVPGITNNMYYTTGVDITLAAADYVFSVSETQTVHFSPGNLQYKYDEGWRFAEHQYDFIDDWWDDEWVDLFGWGTWTGNTPNPLQTSSTYSLYTWDNDDFTQEDYLVDASQRDYDWRTLTKDEWQYILNNSTYGNATITGTGGVYNDVHGIIILPDGSSLTINTDHNSWDNNTISASVWASNFEAYGVVFLPAASIRGGEDVTGYGNRGEYWSSTLSGNVRRAWCMSFPVDDEEDEYEAEVVTDGIIVGRSVRLVR